MKKKVSMNAWVLALALIAGIGLQVNVALGDHASWYYFYHGVPGSYGNEAAYSLIRGSDNHLYTAGWAAQPNSPQYCDFKVISLTQSGVGNFVQNWVYTLNGFDGGNDYAQQIIQGGDGNIYVAGVTDYTGYRSGTMTVVSLTPNGALRWVWRSKKPQASYVTGNLWSLTWGADGNLYAAGGAIAPNGKDDIVVLSLTPSGQLRWKQTWDYAGYDDDVDNPNTIVYGPDSNIYVTGGTWGPPAYGTYLVILSFTSGGTFRWYRVEGGGTAEKGESITCDPSGNIYAGGCDGPLAIVSTHSDGSPNWIFKDNSSSSGMVERIIRGSDGNLYVGGWESGRRYAVLSVNSNGGLNWRFLGPPPPPPQYSGDGARDVAYSNGVVYSTGLWGSQSQGGSVLYGKVAIIKNSASDGSLTYSYLYEGLPPNSDLSFSLALSTDQYVKTYVAGQTDTNTNGYEYTIIGDQQLPGGTSPVGIEKSGGITLFPNSPNPFVGKTEVSFSNSTFANVALKVFNSSGELVKTLVNEPENPGLHKATWDGTDDLGRKVSAGMYFCRLVAGGKMASRTITLSKIK